MPFEFFLEIFLVVLPWLLVVLAVFGAVIFFSEEEYACGVFSVLLVVVLILATLYSYSVPKETIQVDGYTYELYEQPPEQFIERNGYTYKLQESEHDTDT